MAARTKAKNQQETGRLSCFYDLTEENLDEWGEEEEDSNLNSIDLSNVKMLNEKPALHETPAAKREESPCRKTTDPDSSQESENSAIHVPAPEETPRGGLVNKETPPSAVAPSYTGNILHERHSLLDVKSSSVKLLLLRQDTSEDGNTRLIIEKIWDLKTPVEIGRRLSQSADITNGLFNGRLISRKHAIVYAEGDKVLLCDVGSSHGTFINGQRVVTFKELHDGDRLSLGQFSNGKAPYIVQIIQGAGRKEADDSEAEPSASTESKKRKRENENDGIDDVAYFIFDGLENVENRIAKRLRVSSAISAVLGGVVGGLSVGCAIVGLANMG